MDDAAQSDRFLTGQYELRIARPGTYTSDVAVDDQFAGLMFDSAATNNLFTHSKTPNEAALFRKATREMDEDRRRELFAQMHVESMKNALVIPLSYTPNRAAVSTDVHDFNYLVSGWWRLDTVWKG
jgi:peptide/nickel transport system substrate-binding protein